MGLQEISSAEINYLNGGSWLSDRISYEAGYIIGSICKLANTISDAYSEHVMGAITNPNINK